MYLHNNDTFPRYRGHREPNAQVLNIENKKGNYPGHQEKLTTMARGIRLSISVRFYLVRFIRYFQQMTHQPRPTMCRCRKGKHLSSNTV